MKRILANSFSINMLNSEVASKGATIKISPVAWPENYILSTSNWEGAIGHADTRRAVEIFLKNGGCEYPPQNEERPTITVDYGDEILVAQYRGARLPEGATTLPVNAKIEWFLVKIEEPESEK